MRKLLVTATTAAIFTAAVSTPAWAAAPEAPTDVQIAWADGKVRVTWKDNGDPNVVRAEYVDKDQVLSLTTTTAEQSNEVAVTPNHFLDRDRIRILVTSRVTGQGSSAAAASPLFDARIPVYPFIEDADLLADQSVRLRWKQPTVEDLTPNDPLDRTIADEYLGVQLGAPGSQTKEKIAVPAGSTTFTVPARPRPWSITMYAGNEWQASYLHGDGNGPGFQRTVNVGTVRTGISGVPAQASYGSWMPIRASLTSSLYSPYFDRLELQARPSSTAAWRTYGRYNGYADDVSFDTGIGSLGGRQYRIWVPARKKIEQTTIDLTPAASSSTKSSRTTANMLITRFEPDQVTVGQTTKLNVYVRPELSMKAALQQWDGKQWRYVRAVPLTKGRAIVPIKATRRGTTTFRIATPPVTVNGLPVLATTSKPFTLTIR